MHLKKFSSGLLSVISKKGKVFEGIRMNILMS